MTEFDSHVAALEKERDAAMARLSEERDIGGRMRGDAHKPGEEK